MNRRNFIKNAGAIAALGAVAFDQVACSASRSTRPFRVVATDFNFEREPLIRPFGFKGGFMTEIWQSAAMLQGDSGIRKIGVCTHNVLWSDAAVFEAHSTAGGDAMMFAIGERGMQMIKGQTFQTPVHMIESIIDELWAYGKQITCNPNLKKTFITNALIGVDNAAWLLWAAENSITKFDDMIPAEYLPALSYRYDKVAAIPLGAYNIPINEVVQAVDDGYFIMKIKVGQPGTQEEMLQKDMARLSEIHQAIGHRATPHTENGKIFYNLDANGRYESKETLQRLLDHAKKIGAFDMIGVFEEPLMEEVEDYVGDMGILIATDESAHDEVQTAKRIQMGYKAVVLKAAAKTLSITLKMTKVAHEHGVPCMMSDLTVNPILVEWNKNVASRCSPFPGLGIGVLESNGHQNYINWNKMLTHHPTSDASWAKIVQGAWHLNHDYFERSGGIYEPSPHYEQWFKT